MNPQDLILSLKKLVEKREIDYFGGGDNFISPLIPTDTFRKYDTEFRWDDLNEDWLQRYIDTKWRFPTPNIYLPCKKIDEPLIKPISPIKWSIKHSSQIKRFGTYRMPLHKTLEKLLNEDPSRKPTAKLVKAMWEIEKPSDIEEVLADEFKYFNTNGKLKLATWNALGKAINNLIIKIDSQQEPT